MGDRAYSLAGVTLVTPDQVHTNAALTIADGRIASLERTSKRAFGLNGYVIYPGLLNAHDHLLGTWWPRVAPRRPYLNVYKWLDDYEKSPVLKERSQNSDEDMYEFGAYRNLISGVTTVADHFLRINGPEFYTRHQIDVLHEYGRTWLPRTLRRDRWGGDIPTEYGLAVRTGRPYVIHLAEGLDAETAQEMDVLTRFDAVGRNTLIIHGIGLRPQDMELLATVGASVCWCPVSNLYLYQQTANVPALLDAGVNLTLGTDSSMTGGLNVLDEVRTGRDAYRDQTGEDPPSRWLVEMMTVRAAYALMLDDRRGCIQVGYEADLTVLADRGSDPYTNLIEADIADIALVIRGGIPIYGDSAFLSLFEQYAPAFVPVVVSGKPKFILGDVLGLLNRMTDKVSKQIEFPFLPCTAPDAENNSS